MTAIDVEGYRLDPERLYQPDTHVWVQPVAGGRLRVGLDPLGVETLGTLAMLALGPPGTSVARGEPLGTMEAEKFVGPLAAPVTGLVTAVNDAVVSDPRLVHRDPLGAWLLELETTGPDEELSGLVTGEGAVRAWFASRLAAYRERGVLAE